VKDWLLVIGYPQTNSDMLKTGNVFFDYCLAVAGFLPLLPALLILVKKTYLKEPMNFLLIICLLNFLSGWVRRAGFPDAAGQPVIHNIFALLEMVFLALLFRPGLGTKMKNAVNVFLIAFLSAIFTYFSLRGWGSCNVAIDSIEAFIIVGILLLSLPPLIRSTPVYVLQTPQIWIAGGTVFYFFTLILLEWVGGSCFLPVSRPPDTEKMILLAIAEIIRYLLYTGAVLIV
jgi:hypothetical protein